MYKFTSTLPAARTQYFDSLENGYAHLLDALSQYLAVMDRDPAVPSYKTHYLSALLNTLDYRPADAIHVRIYDTTFELIEVTPFQSTEILENAAYKSLRSDHHIIVVSILDDHITGVTSSGKRVYLNRALFESLYDVTNPVMTAETFAYIVQVEKTTTCWIASIIDVLSNKTHYSAPLPLTPTASQDDALQAARASFPGAEIILKS